MNLLYKINTHLPFEIVEDEWLAVVALADS